MTMQPILDVRLEGPLDHTGLGHLQKLLNLEPQGRLTDTEDESFGHRALPASPGERLWLGLWRQRQPAAGWVIRLTYSGTPPGPEVVARCRAEVIAATRAVGLAVTGSWPEPAEPVPADAVVTLPSRRALSVRLAGGERTAGRLDLGPLERLRRGLNLRREPGGPSGTEFGWRYVHTGRQRGAAQQAERYSGPSQEEQPDTLGNAQLLQLFDDPGTGAEVALLFDRQPPPEEVVAGCRLQIAVAADQAGMTVSQSRPEPPRNVPEPDWAELARRAATAETLPELLPAIGCGSDTPYELTRGRLLAITARPEWKAAGSQLRWQVDDYLVGLP